MTSSVGKIFFGLGKRGTIAKFYWSGRAGGQAVGKKF